MDFSYIQLAPELEQKFVRQVYSQMQALESAMSGTFSVIDKTKKNRSVEQKMYLERLGKLVEGNERAKAHQPKDDLDNEFTPLFKDLRDFCEYVPRISHFQDGLTKILDQNVLEGLLKHHLHQARSVFS
jgi:hypothetical protein